jgi:hypothetical protein
VGAIPEHLLATAAAFKTDVTNARPEAQDIAANRGRLKQPDKQEAATLCGTFPDSARPKNNLARPT